MRNWKRQQCKSIQCNEKKAGKITMHYWILLRKEKKKITLTYAETCWMKERPNPRVDKDA